jgi:NAD(P)-dependent dehydrogenase (short-subunit alcohol dehydrogenase family)
MSDRVVIITGASDGIGAAAARQLAAQGYRLLLVGRSPEKTARIAREVGAEFFVADFEKLHDVRRIAGEIRASVDHVDVLANNAGGLFGDRTITLDGNERTMQVNHLAPFLLTNLLIDLLIAGDGVVVNTASSAARLAGKLDIEDLGDLTYGKRYSAMGAYGDAKLANILFTRGLQARYGTQGISAVAFDPGNVRTNFASDTSSIARVIYRTPLSRLMLISAEKGGSNLAFFVDGIPGTTWIPGQFYIQTKLATDKQTNPRVANNELVDGLWQRSAEIVRATI